MNRPSKMANPKNNSFPKQVTASTAKMILSDLKAKSDRERAQFLQGFFKTGKGQYAEGDKFLGLPVPLIRKIARKHYRSADPATVLELLQEKWHEARFIALLIWILQFEKGDEKVRRDIYRLYYQNRDYVNNWDLVDLSAPKIVGAYLFEQNDPSPLYRLARDKNIWRRRIAMLATYYFICQGHFTDAIKLAEILLDDSHDLIHKASGWMLREVGKRKIDLLEKFLQMHCHKMPRTMLRYAIEKLPEKRRKAYLSGSFAKSLAAIPL